LIHRHIRDGLDYHIPYRSMLPKGLENVIVGGRAISTDRVALGSIRVMAQCMAMGEAAGTAAAMAVRKGTTPRALDIRELRGKLASQGAVV
jgi:hypothetical protein